MVKNAEPGDQLLSLHVGCLASVAFKGLVMFVNGKLPLASLPGPPTVLLVLFLVLL